MGAATVPYVSVGGSPFAIGFGHGRARGAALRAFLDDGLARLNRLLPKPVTRDDLKPQIDGYAAAIAAATPELAEEIHGLAAGAEIHVADAMLLQARREILGYSRIPTLGDCTTYAYPGVLAQTVDLNGDLDDQLAVLDVAKAGSPRRVLVLSFGGLLGYLGINSSGLAVGLNLVLGGDWRPGLPPYLAIRHLLDVADTVAEAVGVLRSLPLASSRSIMLADASRVGYAEVLGDEVRFHEAPVAVHTNHFLDPSLAARDEVNVFARNSSVRRLDAARAALSAADPGDDAEGHFAILSAPPICVPDSGDIRRERTVAAIVAYATRGQLYVRPGDPSQSTTNMFRLREPMERGNR